MVINAQFLATLLLAVFLLMFSVKIFTAVGRTYDVILGVVAFVAGLLFLASIVHVG